MGILSSDEISRLREIFEEMANSRRQLRPILEEISEAIDKGFFLDADSEEVRQLLEQILEAQGKFFSVEQLRPAAVSQKLNLLDSAISKLEQDCQFQKAAEVLEKIATLAVKSDAPAILEAIDKIKANAANLQSTAKTADALHFARRADKFVVLAEAVARARETADISTDDYLRVYDNFSDTPLLILAVTKNLLYFPQDELAASPPELAPVSTVEDLFAGSNEPAVQQELDFQPAYETPTEPPVELPPPEELIPATTKRAITAIKKKFNNLEPPPDLALVSLSDDMDSFSGDLSSVREIPSVKSFGKKLGKLLNSSEAKSIFDIFTVSRIFFKADPKNILVAGKLTRKLVDFIPTVCEKLFTWGLVDKIGWRDAKFYFLNIVGLDLCNRHFKTNVPANGATDAEALFNALREVTMLFFRRKFRSRFKFQHPYGEELPYVRAEAENSADVALIFSLILLGEAWPNALATFKLIIEQEISTGPKDVVFLALSREDLPWLKLFDEAKFKKARFLLFGWDGLWDSEGNELDFETWQPKEIVAEPVEPEPPKPPKSPKSSKSSKGEKSPEPPPAIEPLPADVVKADLIRKAAELFKGGELGRGMLALHALRDYFSGRDDGWSENLAREVGFIFDDPLALRALHNVDTFNFWMGVSENPKASVGADFLNLTATIKNFYAPASPRGHQIRQFWRQLNDDHSNAALKNLPTVKNLIKIFTDFTLSTGRAFASCLNGAGDTGAHDLEAALAQIEEADSVAENVLKIDVNHDRVKYVIQYLLKPNAYVRKFFRVDEHTDAEILDFCQQFSDEDLTAIVDDGAAIIDSAIFSEAKIDDLLDYVWENYDTRLAFHRNEKFIHNHRRRTIIRTMKQALTALANYLHAKRKTESFRSGSTPSAPVDKALENIAELQRQIASDDKKINLGQIVFSVFVENLRRRLNGETIAFSYKNCLLGARYVELDDDLPETESFGVEEFSLRSRVEAFEDDLSGRSAVENIQRAYNTAVTSYDFGIFQHLQKHFPEYAKPVPEEILSRGVDNLIEQAYDNFRKDLELARIYARITDHGKIDAYINAVTAAKKHFSDTRNAGLFQRFIDACNAAIDKDAETPSRNLSARLDKIETRLEKSLEEGENLAARFPIVAEIRRQIELKNFSVAEDYMNRIDKEGGNITTAPNIFDADISTLNEFIDDSARLYEALASSSSIEAAYEKIYSSRHSNRKIDDARRFLRGWRSLNSGDNESIKASIREILAHLGYGDGKITAEGANSLSTQKSYTVTFDAAARPRNYQHPFAIFGSKIYTKGLEILYVNAKSSYTPDGLVQILRNLAAPRGTICLVNFAITLPDRRRIANLIKLDPNLKNIIIVDQVVALYLARFDDTNRGKKMLQIALPFAFVQPYTSMGKGAVAPEMFIGRSDELEKIRDMAGPVFVYGGRQLGKSALLRQVRSLEHNPAELNYAFVIDLKGSDSEMALRQIVQALQAEKLLGEVETWAEFSSAMHKLLSGQLRGVQQPKKLILLLDESDAFLSDPNIEIAINILRQLLGDFQDRFKFVLAGLHKVIRFEKNSSFTNLSHISVRPFGTPDAMELFVKPMSYLGFDVVDKKLISTILGQTNYYPGLIQHYCQMLVEAVKDLYANRYFTAAQNPPYPLNDDYLKNMLGNNEFQREIRQRFQDTLAVDDDNYYEILALAVAWIGDNYGDHPAQASVAKIRETCTKTWEIEKIARLSDAELRSLLDEMVELNLFRRVDDDKFEFNLYSFRQMLGTTGEVENRLLEYSVNEG